MLVHAEQTATSRFYDRRPAAQWSVRPLAIKTAAIAATVARLSPVNGSVPPLEWLICCAVNTPPVLPEPGPPEVQVWPWPQVSELARAVEQIVSAATTVIVKTRIRFMRGMFPSRRALILVSAGGFRGTER